MLDKIVWNINDLSNALGRSPGSIRSDIHRENWLRVPPPTRLAGTLVWRPGDVEAWLELRAKESGALIVSAEVAGARPATRRRPGRPRIEG